MIHSSSGAQKLGWGLGGHPHTPPPAAAWPHVLGLCASPSPGRCCPQGSLGVTTPPNGAELSKFPLWAQLLDGVAGLTVSAPLPSDKLQFHNLGSPGLAAAGPFGHIFS